jgi:hypothetical protein
LLVLKNSQEKGQLSALSLESSQGSYDSTQNCTRVLAGPGKYHKNLSMLSGVEGFFFVHSRLAHWRRARERTPRSKHEGAVVVGTEINVHRKKMLLLKNTVDKDVFMFAWSRIKKIAYKRK